MDKLTNSTEMFWSHPCNERGDGVCLSCGKQMAWGGTATVEPITEPTEDEIRQMVRDNITVPSLRELIDSGFIGTKSTVTYPTI